MRYVSIISIIAVIVGVMAASGVQAATPVTWDGSIELRSPVWNSAYGGVTNTHSMEMAGQMKVHHLLGPFVLTVSGVHTFDQASIYRPENKLNLGLELPLGHRFTVFGYFDRRFADDDDRFFVGVRMGFSGRG